MRKPQNRNRLGAGELRELQRINRSTGAVSAYLGKESESTAESLCQELRQIGTIKEFWRIPSKSTLDRQGIDFICQTARGYFLINAKKSISGVIFFYRERERRQDSNGQPLLIYAWCVTLEVGKRQEAKTELEMILSKDPSFTSDTLPEYIKQELIKPTYSSWKKTSPEHHVMEGAYLSVRDRLDLMKKNGLLKNLQLNKKSVWEFRLTAVVNGLTIEVTTHGEHDQAEKEAYEKLLNEIERRVA